MGIPAVFVKKLIHRGARFEGYRQKNIFVHTLNGPRGHKSVLRIIVLVIMKQHKSYAVRKTIQ